METKDLALAAYLRMKGFKLCDIRKVDGEFAFQFEDTAEIYKASLEYVNSDFARFEAAMRGLKKLIRSLREREEGKVSNSR
jgi:hypothetical protein